MLIFSFNRGLVIGVAVVLTCCAPPPVEAATASFFLSSVQPNNYVAVHSNNGRMLFRFSNLNGFAVQIDGVAVQDPFCYGPDCSNAPDPKLQQDAITNLSLSGGTTCGIGAFLQPGESCTVEVRFDVIRRLPDPNMDYGEGFFAVVDAHRAGDAAVTGAGIQEGFVYVVNPGTGTADRPSLPPVLRQEAVLLRRTRRQNTAAWGGANRNCGHFASVESLRDNVVCRYSNVKPEIGPICRPPKNQPSSRLAAGLGRFRVSAI
jgi:hypothetical protein